MFDKFGEITSYEKINELARNLKQEGDVESLYVLAKENGIDNEIIDAFLDGDMIVICDPTSAAIGKITVEEEDLKPAEIMVDWLEYLKAECMESEEMAIAVRSEGKTVKGAIAEILKWSFAHQHPVDKEILKAAGVNAGKVTLGIPGMGQVKKILNEYYRG